MAIIREGPMDFCTFQLQIGSVVAGTPGASGQDPASKKYELLARSGQGEERGILELPWSEAELRPLAARPETWQVLSRSPGRDLEPLEERTSPAARALGEKLYAAAFSQRIRELFLASRAAARAGGQGLALEIEVDPQEPGHLLLYSLPWELLHDGGGFLGLSRGTPISRRFRVAVPTPGGPLAIEKLKVLAVTLPQVPGLSPLALETEIEALEDLERRTGSLELKVLREPSLDQLALKLEEGGHHVLHLLGHGGFDSALKAWVLYFRSDGEKEPVPLPAASLAAAFEESSSRLRLVVMNACRSGRATHGDLETAADAGLATALTYAGIPAVLAMQGRIGDRGAIELSRALYPRLAAGYRVADALGRARVALHGGQWNGSVGATEWATPILVTRGSARLFEGPTGPRPLPELPRPWSAVPLGLGSLGAILLVVLGILWIPHGPSVSAAFVALVSLLSWWTKIWRRWWDALYQRDFFSSLVSAISGRRRAALGALGDLLPLGGSLEHPRHPPDPLSSMWTSRAPALGRGAHPHRCPGLGSGGVGPPLPAHGRAQREP